MSSGASKDGEVLGAELRDPVGSVGGGEVLVEEGFGGGGGDGDGVGLEEGMIDISY